MSSDPDGVLPTSDDERRESRASADGTSAELELFRRTHAPELRGDHPVLLEALDVIRRIADTDATVLITGESGTGKELVARAIHRASERAARPFVAINCGALPESLLESELFGHAKGAFTGAHVARVGRFAQADGGSIFLDEIGEITASLQVKLLRVLQERDVTPIGDSRTYRVDVRVIAATNRDLEAMSASPGGGFRADLFYRLNVIQLVMPPLRERASDIAVLLAHFVEERNRRHNRRVTGVSPDALAMLSAYAWPGNVRELQNVVERMVVLKGQGQIEVRDLPERIRASKPASTVAAATATPLVLLPEEGLDLRDVLDQLEHHLIRQALERAGGNKNRAAALLKLQRTTLVEKLKRRGMLQPGDE